MTSNDFTWDDSVVLATELIPPEVLPGRYALTAPQIVQRKSTGEILLIDPHAAGTWETWMFPYSSLIVSNEELQAKQSGAPISVLTLSASATFGDLSGALDELRRLLKNEYLEAIQTGVNNVLPQLSDGWQGDAIYQNYSLKYSKTSNSFTAYSFEYYLNVVNDLAIEVPSVWVHPDELRSALEKNAMFMEKTVSSNVRDVLGSLAK